MEKPKGRYGKTCFSVCLVLQASYGPRRTKPPNLCSNSSFDALFEYPAGVIYVLKGKIFVSWFLSYLMTLHELHTLFTVSHEITDVEYCLLAGFSLSQRLIMDFDSVLGLLTVQLQVTLLTVRRYILPPL
jgi:hypothetical protein